MKIYTQDRKAIIELPKEIWATAYGLNRSAIIGTSYIAPSFGIYEGADRAAEILKEIFEYHRAGKKTYIMPEK